MLTRDTIVRMYPGQMVSHYLLAAYCYYHLDVSPMTDDAFDLLAKLLLEIYDTVEHQHKHLITKDDLAAGTLLLPKDKYPLIIRGESRLLGCNAMNYYEDCVSDRMYWKLQPHLKPQTPQGSLF